MAIKVRGAQQRPVPDGANQPLQDHITFANVVRNLRPGMHWASL
jgi:hypothetical protein